MHLINTIELSPYDFADKEYGYPNSSASESQQNEFESRIKKTLEKMGIANAEQIAKIMKGNA